MSEITKTKDGRYCQRIYYIKPDGKKSQKRIYGDTLKELRLNVTSFQLQAEEENSNYGTLTLADALEQMQYRSSNILAPNTINNVAYTIKRIGSYANTLLSQVSNVSAQALVNRLAAKYKVSTIRHTIGLINVALEPYDISVKVKYPKETSVDETYIPSQEEFERLLEVVKGTRFELPVLLGGYCGLRKGEVFALTYDDFKEGKVFISKTVSRSTDGGFLVKAPKTKTSNRVVPIPTAISTLVKNRKKKRLPLFELTYSAFNFRWTELLEENGFKHFKFHSLRHYYASRLITLGIPSKYAIELTGHSSVTTLEKVYQHTMKDYASRVESILREGYFNEK